MKTNLVTRSEVCDVEMSIKKQQTELMKELRNSLELRIIKSHIISNYKVGDKFEFRDSTSYEMRTYEIVQLPSLFGHGKNMILKYDNRTMFEASDEFYFKIWL